MPGGGAPGADGAPPLLLALLLVHLFDPVVVQAERRLRLPRVATVSGVLVKDLEMASRAPAPDARAVAIGLPGPTAVYLAVQLVEGWALTPWIQGRTADLSAVTVLIVVLVGGAVAGLYGLLLAIPVAACAKILLREVALPRLERWAARS